MFITYSTYNVRNWGACSLNFFVSFLFSKNSGQPEWMTKKKLVLVSATKKNIHWKPWESVNLHDFMGSFVCEGANKRVKAGGGWEMCIPQRRFFRSSLQTQPERKGNNVFFLSITTVQHDWEWMRCICRLTQGIHGPGKKVRRNFFETTVLLNTGNSPNSPNYSEFP